MHRDLRPDTIFISEESYQKSAGLRSVSGVPEQSKPVSVGKTDKSDEKTPKKPGQKKKNHLTRVK